MSDFQELVKSFPKTREYVRDFLSTASRPGMNSRTKAPGPTTMSGGAWKAGLEIMCGKTMYLTAPTFLLP